MRNKKWIMIVSILLVVAILGVVAFQYLTINGRLRLSLRSEEQLRSFLEDYGIGLSAWEDVSVKEIIIVLEEDIEYEYGKSDIGLDVLYNNIRVAVKHYYGFYGIG